MILSLCKQRGILRSDVAAIVAVIATLVGAIALFMPQWGERTRRDHCADNLRILSQALHSYESINGTLPIAARWSSSGLPRDSIVPGPIDPLYPNINSIPFGTYKDTTHENWAISLLPFLNEVELYDSPDWSEPINSPRNAVLREKHISTMVCPADSNAVSSNMYVRQLPASNDARYARGTYAINGGTSKHCAVPGIPSEPCADGMYYEIDPHTLEFKCWWNGVAGINMSFSTSDFVRGKSRIVVLDEVRAGLTQIDPRGAWALGQIGGSITRMHGIYGDAHVPNAPGERSDDIIQCSEIQSLVGKDRLQREKMGCCSYCVGNIQSGARSMHSGGVYVLFADGAITFMVDGVDPNVWHALHSTNSDTCLPDTVGVQ